MDEVLKNHFYDPSMSDIYTRFYYKLFKFNVTKILEQGFPYFGNGTW